MAYIGKQPVVGNFVKLDAITTSATATYNLLNGGVAYFPQTANNCIVSLNGVIQSPTSAYTISGSTIVFSDALTSSDTIDFILVLGDVLSIGTPSDGTVSFAKVTSNLITGATSEATIDGADSVLIFDDSASALRKMTRTNFVAGIGATAGQVIQVVSTTKTDTFSTASTSFVDVTGLSVSITPSSVSNKILIIANVYGNNTTQYSFARLMRDSTAICIADTNSSNVRSSFANYYTSDDAGLIAGGQNHLDSPATTSSITYKIQVTTGGSGTIYINRGTTSDTGSSRGRTASSITVMEIKG